MDDRAVNILDNYELKVLRTWKGRGAILCETDQGLKIIKEFIGPKERIRLQDSLLTHIKEAGFVNTEMLVHNKEDELITYDVDQTAYVVKSYFDGKECNFKEVSESEEAMAHLAKMHKVMQLNKHEILSGSLPFSLEKEYEKHNKELKKVKNFVRSKSQKSDFEIALMKYYDIFYDEACNVEEELKLIPWEDYEQKIKTTGSIAHGDYQYHNILMNGKNISVINFEKCVFDSRVRDVYLFMRKVLEKNDWSPQLGEALIVAYDKQFALSQDEMKQLYFRFLYPEKFWKIVNFYFNSGKAFISSRNMEKLDKLLKNKEDMQIFINFMKDMIS